MDVPREVALRVFEAVNAHDLTMLRGPYAPEARTLRPGWPQEADVESLLASYEMDFACVPDIRFESLSSLTDGDRIVTGLRITGSNTGPTVLGDFGKALLGGFRDTSRRPPEEARSRGAAGLACGGKGWTMTASLTSRCGRRA
jgi:SnoaL-like domain